MERVRPPSLSPLLSPSPMPMPLPLPCPPPPPVPQPSSPPPPPLVDGEEKEEEEEEEGGSLWRPSSSICNVHRKIIEVHARMVMVMMHDDIDNDHERFADTTLILTLDADDSER